MVSMGSWFEGAGWSRIRSAVKPASGHAWHLLRLLVAVLLAWLAVSAGMRVEPSSAASRANSGRQGGEGEAAAQAAAPLAGMNKVPYQAKCRLPSGRVQFAAPAIGDLDHDSYQEIVVGTSDGWVFAVKPDKPDCTLLWSFDTAVALNAQAFTPSGTTISQAPVIADLDGDGWNEIVIPVGTITSARQNGAVLVLSHTGQLMPGWPQMSFDKYETAYTEGVATAPVVVDLDGDGKKEIVAGSFDNRVYVWRHDGSWLKGWPRHVFDTVWSSPAAGDLDHDGLMEIVIGVDAHADPYFGTIDGGALYAFRSDGTVLAGFPKYIKQNIESTPALVDLNADGYLDIVVGGGTFYSSGPDGYKVHAFDRHGDYLPGWPKSTGGNVSGSPAIADIDADGLPEVVVGSWDGKFYAWRYNGTPVPGWPVTPHTWTGDNYRQYSAIIANLDGSVNPNGRPEILTNSGWEVLALDASGSQLTWDGAAGNPQSKPTYWADWTLDATPVVADVDADGKLELIAGGGDGTNSSGGNGILYVWKLPNSRASDAAKDWPMFKRASDRASNAAPIPGNDAIMVRHNIPKLMMPGQSMQAKVVLRNAGTGAWNTPNFYLSGSSSGVSLPSRAELPPGSVIAPGQEASFTFTIVAPSVPGYYSLNWRMAQNGNAFGRALALSLKVGSDPAYYVLRAATAAQGGGLHPGGLAEPIQPPAGYQSWERAGNVQSTIDEDGYYLLDKAGYITWAGTAPDIGSITVEPPAVEMRLGPDRQGYFIINANGKLRWGGGYMEICPAAPTFSDGRVRSFAVTSDYKGIYVLDRNGQVYVGGTAKALTPPASGLAADSALKIELTRDGKGYYVLDRYGGVHKGGAAPVLEANYSLHIGEDWARDFELTDDGSGYFMLDKFGGIHTGGLGYAAMQKPAPAWADGTAVDLVMTDIGTINSLIANPSALTGLTTPSKQLKFLMKLNSGLGSVSWRASADQPWLKIDMTTGSTPAEFVITADPRGLPLGKRQGTITISGDGVANSPVAIPVQLQIVDHLHTAYLPQIVR